MSDDAFLKNPLSLFDVRGKTAIVTGASGAFGALAAKTRAGAGAKVVRAARNQDELNTVAAGGEQLGGKETVLKANDSCVIEANETRENVNRGNEVCTILVAIATPH